MSRVFDTVIVGAGMGGLTAAAKLAGQGLRVLVLEKNPHVGGTAFVYRRKGFTFPMGPLGFSNPGLVRETLRELGDGDELKLSRVHFRIKAFDLDIPISLPFSEMIETLSGVFPSDAKAIGQFFEAADKIISNQRNSIDDNSPIHVGGVSQVSASDYLSGLVKDRRLCRVLGSLGTMEPYSNLPLLAAMWNLMCREGIWYPREGMQSFCERLQGTVVGPPGDPNLRSLQRTATGSGDVWLMKEVTRILVEKNKALGVTLRDGTVIESASVISNADYKTTFMKLIDPAAVPPEWYSAVTHARQTGSIFQVCLGVDARRADLSVFREAGRVIYRRRPENARQTDLNLDVPEIDPEALARQELEVSVWGQDDLRICPEGSAVIVIRTEAIYSHFARYRSLKERRTPEYQGYKTRLAHRLIREIEPLVPGIGNAILVLDVATPLTFEDQGGRSGGAVAGWSWDYEDSREDKPSELVRTPIQGLYMGGYQAFSALFMGGLATAMESGKRAAHAVLERAEPIQEVTIPLALTRRD